MPRSPKNPQRLTPVWRALIEIAFIIFLFYANLLMGDFTSTKHTRSIAFALRDIITPTNFVIGMIAALIGYSGFEYLRKKL